MQVGDFEDYVRAVKACEDYKWVCMQLVQWMPLGDQTCDIHQVAENLVSVYKSVARETLSDHWLNPNDAALMKSVTYQQAMERKCAERNESGADRRAIKRGCVRTKQCARVVAADKGVEVEVHFTHHKRRKLRREAARQGQQLTEGELDEQVESAVEEVRYFEGSGGAFVPALC